jgi:hypothetical protein
MPYQTNSNILVAIKREATIGVAPGATGAHQLRITDSPGLELQRAQILSAEKRKDLTRPMGRIGGKSVAGSYNAEATVGGAVDMLIESIMRSAWAAAAALSTGAVGRGITTTTNTITAASGSFLTDGIRVGDVIRLTGHATAANNDLNLRVAAVTATVITVAGNPLTADAVGDETWTITRQKKLITASSPTRYSHAIEQYDTDIDMAELFLGCRLVGFTLGFQPGAHATVQFTFQGLDRAKKNEAESPYFTSPSVTTGLGLVADDSAIRMNGAEVAKFTGLTLNFNITASGVPVIGSFVSPDIFDNDMAPDGQITGLRSNFANLDLYDAETEFELSILLEEPESRPKDFLSFFLPRVKIASLSAPVGGGDGAKVETLGLMVGPRVATTGYDGTVAVICSSAS